MVLVVICGATASGKSSLGLRLAQRWQTEIISADSRQVYREFDIGTAKASASDRQLVPHHLIDIADPWETLTLADYQQRAQGIIDRFHRRHGVEKPLLLVGGTGLYIKAITRGLKIPRVPPHDELRSQFNHLGQSHCYQLLAHLDPTAAAKIHPHDQVRTQRALEVFYVTGQPISQQQGETPPTYPVVQLYLDGPAEILNPRIAQRTAQMIRDGFREEVAALLGKYGPELPLLQTLGYGEFLPHLRGEIDLEAAQALTVLHTCQFAKRQRTWFRRVPDLIPLPLGDPHLEAIARSTLQAQGWHWA